MVGPEASRFVLITAHDQLHWRPESDPVTKLLRRGLLVTDGEEHDKLRRIVGPAMHRGRLGDYVETMWRDTDEVAAAWTDTDGPVDMLVEMRRLALLIVMDSLFQVDFRPDMTRMFPVILDTLRYISPGLWTVWPQAPRPGYAIVRCANWMHISIGSFPNVDGRRRSVTIVLGLLVGTPEMTDELIRDQVLTLLIAGHDTSTALLAWTLYLLGSHPDVARARS